MADLRFKSWSASRLDDYNSCPFMAMHKHLLKTCPICFKGKLKGWPEQKCDTCGKSRPVHKAMSRGGEIGQNLEKYVNGTAARLHKEITNPDVKHLAKLFRAEHKKGLVQVEMTVNLDRNFKVLGHQWSPEIWLIAKLDVWHVGPNGGGVTDWKTGGLDKRTGEIKADAKYDDQLMSYKVVSLCKFPEVKAVSAALCFVDAKGDPMVIRDPLARKDLEKAKKSLVKLSLPIMSDTKFAPTPSWLCTYCDFAKRKGGPCKLGG